MKTHREISDVFSIIPLGTLVRITLGYDYGFVMMKTPPKLRKEDILIILKVLMIM